MENKVLSQFKSIMKKEIEGLDLIITPLDSSESYDKLEFEIMDSKENGRCWNVECTTSGEIENVFEIGDLSL